MRSLTATVATDWWGSACRTSIRWSGATRSRTLAAGRWSGATPTDSAGVQHGPPLGHRRLDGAAGGAAGSPGRGVGLDHGPARDRMAQGPGRDDHRARDHAAHGREHRFLQPDRPRARAAHRHAGARRTPPRRRGPRVAFDGGPPGTRAARRMPPAHRDPGSRRGLQPGDDAHARPRHRRHDPRPRRRRVARLRPVAFDTARGRPCRRTRSGCSSWWRGICTRSIA